MTQIHTKGSGHPPANLESSRLLVSTSILKNLILPGIGHLTILDPELATNEDVGNNFFLNGLRSVGKNKAKEAVRLLGELNEGVEGRAESGVGFCQLYLL